MDRFKHVCLNYRNQLRPFLEMLKQKKTSQKREHWLAFVKKTERDIIKTPAEYLSELEKQDLMEKAIHFIFDEFLTEMDSAKTKQG